MSSPSLLSVTPAAVSLDRQMLTRLTELAGDLAVNLVVGLLIAVVTVFAAKWASRATRRILTRIHGFRRDQTLVSFVAQIVRVVVYAVGLVAILQRLGVQTTSIIAVLGAASIAIGLALQGTLSNVAAGVLLLVLRPYKVGDIIAIGAGATGSVQRLDLFVTQLVNADNHKIVVPNSKVLGEIITNLSGQGVRRVELKFGVGYGDDPRRARDILVDAARVHEHVLDEPAIWAGVTALLDSSVEISLHAWVKSEHWWQTRADLLEAGKLALDAAGIEIPFPHQVAVPYGEDSSALPPAADTET